MFDLDVSVTNFEQRSSVFCIEQKLAGNDLRRTVFLKFTLHGVLHLDVGYHGAEACHLNMGHIYHSPQWRPVKCGSECSTWTWATST